MISLTAARELSAICASVARRWLSRSAAEAMSSLFMTRPRVLRTIPASIPSFSSSALGRPLMFTRSAISIT